MLVPQLLALECLEPGYYQPRRHFDEQALAQLAQSIAQHGLLKPLIVREKSSHRYEIIAGERRWRAAKLANLHTIACLIGQYSDKQAASLALVENLQRQNLNVIEEAHAYHRLRQEFDLQQDDIAQMVGKSRSHIANLLRLLTLESEVQTALIKQQITLGHARLLVNMPASQQHYFLAEIRQKGWSVRVIEQKARAWHKCIKKDKHEACIDRAHLAHCLAVQVNAPVHIRYM